MLQLNLDWEEFARQLIVDHGSDLDMLTISERVWDFLLEKGYDPNLFTYAELDEINEHVDHLTKKVEL